MDSKKDFRMIFQKLNLNLEMNRITNLERIENDLEDDDSKERDRIKRLKC